jgi:predicted N-acetyltransferase YhbS
MSEQPKRIVIRKATQFDAVKILRLHMESHKEAEATHGLPYPPVDENKTMGNIVRVIAINSAFVADVGDGRVVGSIGVEPQQMPWSAEWHASNPWFDVQAAFRKHGTADALVKAAVALAQDKGLSFFLHFNSAVHPELKDRWAKQRGFTYCGGTLLRTPDFN